MKQAASIVLIACIAFTLLGYAAETEQGEKRMQVELAIADSAWTVTLANNTSAEALLELLRTGPLTVAMRDYARMEKVGPIGLELPRNDEYITAEPGDLILYQGSALVIYYAPNGWNFTRLGKIDNITQEELIDVLGSADVVITLSLIDEKENEE